MPLIATDKIVKDLEKAGALAMRVPPEGGYEGRYQLRLKNAGYDILFMSARGLGDVNSYLTGVHGVRPAHLGKTEIRTYLIPPAIQFRLNALPAKSKGLVVWMIEGKYLSREELETLSQIPDRDPRVKIVIEVGSDREVTWQPLKQSNAA
ncbi:MAG: NAD(P)H-quinone oxidoreductase subunit N [Pseudanabaena sp. CAN_BIN31]|jgi:NAD(P)H-quinone oxidoreductase subunit N|nr:NAD(P)H-quinone oxidoreductase subunit N [Pseudanabaena sp. CAN_BIN31]